MFCLAILSWRSYAGDLVIPGIFVAITIASMITMVRMSAHLMYEERISKMYVLVCSSVISLFKCNKSEILSVIVKWLVEQPLTVNKKSH